LADVVYVEHVNEHEHEHEHVNEHVDVSEAD